MNTRNLITLLALLVGSTAFAQKAILIPYRQGKQWGYADTNGVVRIRPAYESVSGLLQNSRYIVKSKGKMGLIDQQGKRMAPFCYDEIEGDHHQDGFIVKSKGKLGYLSNSGKLLVKPVYDVVYAYGGVLHLTKGDARSTYSFGTGKITPGVDSDEDFMLMGLEDQPKDTVTDVRLVQLTSVAINGQLEVVLKKETVVSYPNGDQQTSYAFDTTRLGLDSVVVYNLSVKYARVNRGGKWGVCTSAGFAIPTDYDEVDPKVVSCTDKTVYFKVRRGSLWGLVSDKGGEALSISYDELLLPETVTPSYSRYFNLKDGIPAKKNGKYGVVDLHDKVLVDFKCDRVEYVQHNICRYNLYEVEGLKGIYSEEFMLAPAVDASEKFGVFYELSGFKVIHVLDSSSNTDKGYMDQKGVRYYKD